MKRGTKVEEVLHWSRNSTWGLSLSQIVLPQFWDICAVRGIMVVIVYVIILTPHLRLELSMCTFDKYIWENYTLQNYSWKNTLSNTIFAPHLRQEL